MEPVTEFLNLHENNLTATEKLLKESSLIIHPAVSQIILMGSRGLQGGFRPDSDIDLGLVLDSDIAPSETLCREILDLSLSGWTGDIELDTAVVYDKMNCGLLCHQTREYNPNLCPHGTDCIGLYKIQKGYSGFIPDIGLHIKHIYPIIMIWEKGR